MKYKLLLIISLSSIILQIFINTAATPIIILIILILLIKNPDALKRYLVFIIPSVSFLILIYALTGRFTEGLKTALTLTGTSLSIQLYFSFFNKLSVYELLNRSGISAEISFIIYASMNYTLMIKPLIVEIQDAQRIRGIEIPHGIRSLFYFHMILIPLMVKLMKGADHLAESIYLRTPGVDKSE